jgi:exonuclease SbcD
LHFGASKFLPDYLERQEQAARTIYKAAVKLKCSLVLLSGDIFHRRNISHQEKGAFVRVLAEYDARGITTVMINGQHDTIEREYTHLRLIRDLVERERLENTHVIESEPGAISLSFGPSMGGVVVVGVPYGDYTSKTLATAVKEQMKATEDHFDFPVVVMAHGIFAGPVLDSGHVLEDGCDLDDDLGVTYWALGDIHKQQQMTDRAWYSGSPIQHDFGDSVDKGFLLVEISRKELPYQVKVTPKRIRKVRPLITVQEDTLQDAPDDAWLRFEGDASTLATTDLPDSVVRVRPRFEAVDRIEEAAELDEVLGGLDEALAAEGLNEEDVQYGAEKAKNYVGQLAD